ncbi:MAG: dockerin type I repeat-containing protein [Candidatus Methanomethylophilaceae archaeon]
MDKKMIGAVAVVVILVVAAVAVYLVAFNGEDNGTPSALDDAELKVYGNINGDRYIDDKDVNLIKQLIDDGKTAKDYPLADANQDGKIDSKDIDVVKNIIAGKSTTVWHINYHDTNGDGVMDEEIVSTKFPVTAAIMTGSTNSFLITYMLGIVDEIKGATYGSSVDAALFSNTYMNTDKVVKLGTSSTSITFEDGKAGSSDVIKTKNVTAVISDWNRTYLTNEDAFETANVDVIRVAAASLDPEVLTHSALLLGLLFQKVNRSVDYVELCGTVMDYVQDAISGVPPVSAVASSMNGYISSEGSDYTQTVLLAGADFGASKLDFGGSTSAKIVDHPEFYTYDCQYVIHLRAAISYGQTDADLKKSWDT